MPRFQDLPFCEHRQQLAQLVPIWPVWPEPEERELALTQEEADFYLQDLPNNGQRFLNMQKKMPTILHSMAHHQKRCPCGCREAFSDITLHQGGVHGFLIRSDESPTGLRHPHPMEIALMNGMSHGIAHRGCLRELLPMLGQFASPVQAHWMLIQWQAVNMSNQDQTIQERHEELMQMIVRSHQQNWPTPAMSIPRTLQVSIDIEPTFEITLTKPTRVSQVIRATREIAQTDTIRWAAPHPPGCDPLLDPQVPHLTLRYGCGKDLWYETLRRRQLHFGSGPDRERAVIEWLSNFLPSKGVEEKNAEQRAKAAVKRLGLEPLESALQAKDPWRSLKAIGNKIGKPFQWITVDELERHIQARAHVRFGADTKPRKKSGKSKRVDTEVHLTPELLELLPDSFEDEEGDPLPMITLESVKPDMRGIALISIDQAPQFLDVKQNMSTDAFALLTIGEIPGGKHENAEPMQWTAIYKPTMEPIIVHGHLISLGDTAVQKRKSEDEQELQQIDTTVVRAQIFRDQFQQDWAALCAGPVKVLIQLIPALQLCRDEQCSGTCKLFHCAIDEEVRQVMVDVWNWRWQDEKGKPVKSRDAASFSVHLRIPLSGLDALLGYSGWSGIFFEPRDSEHDGALRYSTIWLPRGSHIDDAFRHKRSSDLVVGIARMGPKIGLRAYAKNEAEILKLVYPDRHLVNCEIKLIYEMGPFPHTLSKDGVLKMLSGWKWSARPLKILKSTPAGRFWEIGTSTMPPAPFLHTDKGAIAVTKKREHNESTGMTRFQAPSKTMAHLKSRQTTTTSGSQASSDPWAQGNDPWAQYKGAHGGDAWKSYFQHNQKEASAPKKRMAELEERIFTKFTTQWQQKKDEDASMEQSDEVAEKQDRLQVEVDALRAQNEKFEGWGNVEQHMQQQSAQIQELGQAVSAQASTSNHIQH